jgi:hypothetical protein
MSIERDKDDRGYRRSRAGLAVAALVLAAALLLTLEHGTHWPIAMHGFVGLALLGVAMLLFFIARGRSSDGSSSGRGTTKSQGSGRAS